MDTQDFMDLCRIISTIESAGNNWAMRFEPAVYQRMQDGAFEWEVARTKRANKCSLNTAQMIAATSWGQFQIMGFNLYGFLAYENTAGYFLTDETAQRQTFQDFITHKGIAFTPAQLADKETREKFALRYNGSKAYAVKIASLLGK